MLRYFVFLGFLFLGQIALADDGPFRSLVDDYLIENLERNGEWQVTFFESTVAYKCLKCEGSVRAEIEVFPVRDNENHDEFYKQYLYQRKLFCAELVVESIGRCLDTQPRSLRFGAISGFNSSQIVGSRYEYETTFYSRDLDNRPIVMKATVFSNIDTETASGMIRTLEWHMARLTPFW